MISASCTWIYAPQHFVHSVCNLSNEKYPAKCVFVLFALVGAIKIAHFVFDTYEFATKFVTENSRRLYGLSDESFIKIPDSNLTPHLLVFDHRTPKYTGYGYRWPKCSDWFYVFFSFCDIFICQVANYVYAENQTHTHTLLHAKIKVCLFTIYSSAFLIQFCANIRIVFICLKWK